ncbi:hypothetical protein F5888DRAFT_1905224 [Russula emetica]|nr:hypothetical protein F5888DRAFT_1905224 [Russula emetica]
MLLSLLGFLYYFLVFAPRSAFSLFEFVTYSRVSQCGYFNVSFSGGKPPAALPLTLTILPFNSTPLSFVVPNSAWDNSTGSGSFVTLLPLPAGVALLASLDDAAGNSAALISDVLQVQPSANTSCLSSNTAAPAPFQLVTSAVSQCSPFSVSRNTSSLNHPISTRGFIPISLSFKLEWATYHTSQGVDTFTYIMNVAQGLHVALLFDDRSGKSSSFRPCFRCKVIALVQAGVFNLVLHNPLQQHKTVPRDYPVIAISVSSSVVIFITLVLGILFITPRTAPFFILGPLEPYKPARTGTPEAKPSSPAPVDPVYPMFGVSSTGASRAARYSTRSTILGPFTPKSRSLRIQPKVQAHAGSQILDIEGLLEVASQQRAATEAPRGYPGLFASHSDPCAHSFGTRISHTVLLHFHCGQSYNTRRTQSSSSPAGTRRSPVASDQSLTGLV